MLNFEPSVVVVDDKLDEAEGIISHYREQGVGVKFYNASLSSPEKKPLQPFSNLGLIFLDVHYTENRDDYDPELCASWIDSLVSENSFYILVIWSKDSDHEDEIKKELVKINKAPFFISTHQKTDYQNEDGWDFSELISQIDSNISEYHEIEEFTFWKKSVLHSANKVIGHLTQNINSEQLRQKLQKIIIGHGGTYIYDVKDNLHKREVLLDALDNVLSYNSKLSRPINTISSENNDKLYAISKDNKTNINTDTLLNAWFHFSFEEYTGEKTEIRTGLLAFFQNESLKKNYSLLVDSTINEALSSQKDKEIVDIAMVISRPCDLAQNKYGRNLKLLSGIIIKNPNRNSNRVNLSKKPLSIKLYDHLYINKDYNDCSIIFDFRYVFSLPPNIFYERFDSFKLFNKQLVSEIQVEYAAYSSRLGITQVI